MRIQEWRSREDLKNVVMVKSPDMRALGLVTRS